MKGRARDIIGLALAIVLGGHFLFGTISRVSSAAYRRQVPSPDAALWLHLATAGLALVMGLLNLASGSRLRGDPASPDRRRWHRWMGRVYCLGVTLGIVGGFWLVPYSPYAGPLGKFGMTFGLLLWSFFTVAMLVTARRGQWEQHRRWALRSYAISFAGVTLRYMLQAGMAMGWNPVNVYSVSANACFLVNLAVVELLWVRESRQIGPL